MSRLLRKRAAPQLNLVALDFAGACDGARFRCLRAEGAPPRPHRNLDVQLFLG